MKQQGVIGQKSLRLEYVIDAEWRLVKRGGLKLRTSSETVSIYFDNFEPYERLWLIRHFRKLLPEDVQRSWPLFCHRIAVPLRDRDVIEPCGSEDAILTRRRWDLYFVPFVLMTTVLGVVAWLKVGLVRLLAAPVLPIALWLYLRFSTPKEGMKWKRITRQSDQGKVVVAVGSWAGGLFVTVVLLKLMNPPMENAFLGISSLICSAGMFWSANRLDREFQRKIETESRLSVADWENSDRQ